MAPGYPIIRVKASNAEKDSLCTQIMGLFSSFAAIEMQTTDYFEENQISLKSVLNLFYDTVLDNELFDWEFSDRVEDKIAKYQRIEKKMKESLEARKSLGFK